MRSLWLPAAALLLASAPAAADAPEHYVMYPDDLAWDDAPEALPPGSEMVVLAGDPDKQGPFVLRWRAPAGYKVPAHSHPGAETLTVLAGSLRMATGEALAEDQAVDMPAGSFYQLPAGEKHAVWVTEPTVLEIHAHGPFGITYADPADDPRNQAQQAKAKDEPAATGKNP